MEYVIKTHDMVNEHLLHHSLKGEYITNDLEDARRVFAMEVEHLSKEDEKSEFPDDYDFVTHEPSSAVVCEIQAFAEEDGDFDIVERSEYFYINYQY